MKEISDYQQLSILVLEDQDMEWTLFEHALKTGWTGTYSAIRVRSVQETIDYLRKIKFHAVFLDLNVLDSKGVSTVHKVIPENHHKAVVIVTTSMNDQKLAVEALRSGAQDYLIKGEYRPADLAKTLLHALARSDSYKNSNRSLDFPEIEFLKVDLLRQKLLLTDKLPVQEIDLTPNEVKLLSFFILRYNLEVSRGEITEKVMGSDIHVSEKAIDNQISRLRSKIQDTPYQLMAIRGVGYCLTKKEVG